MLDTEANADFWSVSNIIYNYSMFSQEPEI